MKCHAPFVLAQDHPDCFYEPAGHEYTYRQEQWPGVTTILKHGGQIEMARFSETALSRGTRVHHAALGVDEGFAHHVALATDISGECEAYLRFLREIRPEYLCAEQPRWHTRLRFAGRPDRICIRIRGFPGVLELKTGQPYDWHRLQLAGYQLLHPAGARWVVYLKPNGRYELRRHDNPADYDEFLRALDRYWKDRVAA